MRIKRTCTLIANFGGPRSLNEIAPFLEELLTDRDVVRTRLPNPIHNFLFKRIARKRALKIAPDYIKIGGKSPIYDDTEALAEQLRSALNEPTLTFHRYLRATHAEFIEKISALKFDEIRIFPMFPQFTYATTGSIARWFEHNLPSFITSKMRWVKSYPAHPAFINSYREVILGYLQSSQLKEEECCLLFSAHGVPQSFVQKGDLYEDECRLSFHSLASHFPKAHSVLSYQSQFGKEEWLRPYTTDMCRDVLQWHQGRPHILFVPIAFTSDHVETLYEIEEQYLPIIREQGLKAHRIPALNLRSSWISAIQTILQEANLCSNQMLVRRR